MAEVYDPEKLRDIEEGSPSNSPYSTPTTPGRINYTSDNPSSELGDDPLSTSTEPAADEDDGEEDYSSGSQETPDREALAGAEEAGGDQDYQAAEKHEQQVGRGYKKEPEKVGLVRRTLGRRNRLFLLGGSATGVIIIIVVLFLSLLPLKILHIVNNLQSHFFSTGESAVQNETNVLFSDYVRKYVMPALRSCPTSVDRSCNPISSGSLVSQLYKGWRNAKFEDKLATNYGIEFKYSKISGHYYLKAPGLDGNGMDLGTDKSGFAVSTESVDRYVANSKDGGEFKRVTRSQLRSAVNDALSKQSSWKNVMYKYKVGRLLEKKYGFKRCIFACDSKDNFADWKDNKVRAAKLILAERVLAPRSQTLSLVIGCILTDSCDPSHRTEAGGGPNGEPQTKFEKDLQAQLDQLALEETGKYADVLAHSNGILKDGYAKYLAKQVAKKLAESFGGNEAAAGAAEQATSDLIPVVGWVNAAASDIGTLEKAPQKIKALAYTTNAAAMIATYSTYRTYADEIKTGHVDAGLVGSMTDSLGPGDKESLGGTASAEQAPLYGYLIDSDLDSSGNTITSFLSGQAYAVSANPTSSSGAYKCNNGKPVPAGKLVCPEEVLGGPDSQLVAGLKDVLAALGPLKTLADFWNGSAGKLFREAAKLTTYIADGILKIIPGYSKLVGLLGDAIQPIIKSFTDYLIPNPFSDDMSGGRKVDAMAGGADALGSDFSQNELGGEKLTSQQASAILAEQDQESLQDFKAEPLASRIFDRSSDYSVVSKLSLAIPDNAKAASSSVVAALFTDPLGKIASLLSPLFGFGHAQAVGAFPDPFGVTQYGYPDNDPNLAAANQDPDAYWRNNCSSDGMTLDWNNPNNANGKWISGASVDPDTGMPENDSTDPCLLIESAVGSAGATSDSSLLTSDDLGSSGTSSPVTPQPPTTTAGSTIDMANLYKDSTGVACAPGTRDLGTQDGYTGGQKVEIKVCAVPNLPSTGDESTPGNQYYVNGANGQAVVNSRVSGAVYAMVQAAAADHVNLTAISSFRTMAHQQALCSGNSLCASGSYKEVAKPGTSNHQMGLAIDFGGGLPSTPGPVTGNAFWDWLSANAAKFGYKNYPAEAWHWSPTGN